MRRIPITLVAVGCLLAAGARLSAHPMPNSILYLSLQEQRIQMELEMPVQEFELAFKQDLLGHPDKILPEYYGRIEQYLYRHLQINSAENVSQGYRIDKIYLDSTRTELNGTYLEIRADITVPVIGTFDPRNFRLFLDAIIHQVSNHFFVVRVKQDFNNGISPQDSVQLAVIQLDIASNTVQPLMVRMEAGSRWKGFVSMFHLGMQHIREGADHVLFLLTLLLIAPLAIAGNNWSLFQGTRYTFNRFLKISLSFTIGHSVALLAGAYSLFHVNRQYVEILIAVSILLSAVNCMKPIFHNRETWVALGFGCVHGLAFSEALVRLELGVTNKALSILGFNLGIEAMQILFMLLFFPVLLLSRYKFYHVLRWVLAVFTVAASLIWLTERVTGLM